MLSVFDGLGREKTSPVHVLVEELMPNINLKQSRFRQSGLEGFLKLFLPDFTSRCSELRKQQVVALVHFTGKDMIEDTYDIKILYVDISFSATLLSTDC